MGANGALTFVGEQWTRGSYPRSFSFDPTGRFLYCCNQRADSVAVFRVDRQTGGLDFTGFYSPVGNPSIIVFLDLANGVALRLDGTRDLSVGHPRHRGNRPQELAGHRARRQRHPHRRGQPQPRPQPAVRRREPVRLPDAERPRGPRQLRRAPAPRRRRRRLHPAPHGRPEGVGHQGRRGRQARPRREAGRRDGRRRARHDRRLRAPPRAAHGRRHVHAQPEARCPAAGARRRRERRPGPPHRRAVQLRRRGGLRRREHPGRQPARAARLPGGPRLVHDPVRAVGHEVRDADGRHRPPARRRRPGRGARRRCPSR